VVKNKLLLLLLLLLRCCCCAAAAAAGCCWLLLLLLLLCCCCSSPKAVDLTPSRYCKLRRRLHLQLFYLQARFETLESEASCQ
jgi:hypothetical protein